MFLLIVNGGQILYIGADLPGSYSMCAASYDIHIDLRKVKENCLRKIRDAFRSMGTTTQFVLADVLMQEVQVPLVVWCSDVTIRSFNKCAYWNTFVS
jgi:hypothetical protein